MVEISSKANKELRLINRNCRDLKDVSTLRTLHCALVRPQLEYRSVVWSPFTASIVNRGEWLGSPANIKRANKDAKI